MKAKLEFKIASEDWEFEQINELNYRTFVEEIPQHEKNQNRLLSDKFHSENTYIICTSDRKLLGMMAVRDKRPFSLDNKLRNLDSYLPEHRFPCEFRLLSIEKEVRNLRIIQGLMVLLAKLADEKGYDIALISANVKRLRFYRQIGFKEFGPEVGSSDARYQPMYLTLESSMEFRNKSKILTRLPGNFSLKHNQSLNLLPGPINVHEAVKMAMYQPAVSHRSGEFKKDFRFVNSQLCDLTNAANVEILMGSGSLANDAVAAHLSLLNGRGLVLSNGEFGDRLLDHAERAGLNYQTITIPWGNAFDYQVIQNRIADNNIDWLWFVHSETSTGVLNELDTLNKICSDSKTKLCLDCVSSLGTLPVDLSSVYLATGVSGKGLASFSGLSFVFYNHKIEASTSIPRYLDLGYYADSDGIPFTMSSNLVYALSESLKILDPRNRYKEIDQLSKMIRENLRDLGLDVVADNQHATPGLITISLPDWLNSGNIGKILQDEGYLLHWRSKYLLDRNWIQIALMGSYSIDQIKPLFKMLCDLCKPLSRTL